MAKPDLGHRLTDKELAKLEKRIAGVYRQARNDLQDTVDAYFESFSKRDEEMKALIGTEVNGKEYTEQDYKQWRLAQIGRGERFEALRDAMAERMTKANEVAVSYVNDATPGIYSLNRNYAAYTIEQVAGDVGFTLWDEQTVKRLIVEEPELMPYYPPKRAVKRGIDLAYGKKQITAEVTSGILQGKSIKGLADGLQTRIPAMNRDSAIRTARTAVTGAQNAGRIDSYTAAQKMGIKLQKEWLATLDGRTRHSHAMLDGEKVDNDEKFSNGCRFPGDPQGPPHEVYNCRCTLIASLPDVDTSDAQRRARNPETGKSVLIEDMTYQEWAGWKESKTAKSETQKKISTDANVHGTNILAENYEKHRITNDLTAVPYNELQEGGIADNVVYANYGKISEDVAAQFNIVILDLSKEFDTPLQVIRTMTKEEFLHYKDSFAFVSHDYTTDSASLIINPAKCRDAEKLISRIKELSENGYCIGVIEGKELEYVATHEFAHTIANMGQKLSAKTNWVSADYEKIKDFRKEINSVYKDYIKEIGAIEERREELEKIADSLTDLEETLSILEKLDGINEEVGKIKLSDYSMASADEFMAEAFTNSKIGQNKNKYSDIVTEIIGRYFGHG